VLDAGGHLSPAGTGPGDRAVILFNSHELFTLRDKHGLSTIKLRSKPAVEELNRLWRSHRPITVSVVNKTARQVGIRINGAPLIDVRPEDASERDLDAVAHRWSAAIEKAFRTDPQQISRAVR
jgi:hypothetical protein